MTDQAARNQAAGDAFLSTEAFGRAGRLPPPVSLGLNNNVLAINQSPVYVDHFGLRPGASPGVAVPAGTPLDDVDGGGGGTATTNFYFTLAGLSGANIFFDPDITVGANQSLFASASMLSLLVDDDIDALAVFDDNNDGIFNVKSKKWCNFPR